MESELNALQEKLKKQAKTYEAKIQALQAVNAALQTENEKLRLQRREPAGDDDFTEEMEELKEEFQKRLGQSDKTINDLKEERNRLQQLLQQANAGTSSTEQRIVELEASVASLSAEGETLSKRNGELEAALRKLRNSHKDLEAQASKMQELNDRLTREAQSASIQIEELERDLKDLRVELKRQAQESRREVQEALTKAEVESAKGLDHQLALSQEREATIAAQLQDLRAMMHAMAEEHANKEDGWRRQIARLEERSRQLEAEKESVASTASEASRPLLKQIESMAASTAAAAEAAEQAEQASSTSLCPPYHLPYLLLHLKLRLLQRLMAKLKLAETERNAAVEGERAAMAKLIASEAAATAAAASASAAVSQAAEMRGRAESERRGAIAAEAERAAAESRLANALQREEKARMDLEAVTREMGERVWDAEQRIRSLTTERDELLHRLESMAAASSSSSHFVTPTPTPAQPFIVSSQAKEPASLIASQADVTNGINAAEGLEGAEVLESDVDVLLADLARSSEVNRAKTSSSSRKASGFFGLLPLPASQSSEAHDLQGINPGRVHRTIQVLRERLRAAERERDDAAEQLFAAIKRADEREAEGKVVQELKHQLAEAGKRVDFALELLGERNERVEQLEDDISNMKQIFHQQLELCVSQLNEAIAQRQ